LFTACILLISCESADEQQKDAGLLEDIKSKGKLIVLIRNAPTTYYYDRDNNLAGPEYELTQEFVAALGVDAIYKVYGSTKELIAALAAGEGHIAASGITVTTARQKFFDFSNSYQEVSEQLVCHRKSRRITKLEDIPGHKIVVPANTSYIDTLEKLRSTLPDLQWQSLPSVNSRKLMEKVWKQELQCTVADSNIVDINQRYYPELWVELDLAKSRLAWMLPKGNPELQNAINMWLDKYTDEALSRIMEKYYGYIDVFDYVDTRVFMRRINERYPKYKKMFDKAADKHNISSGLLAAISYQESHWNPRAKSPTGVRGIMMLTQPVAKSLGVTDRLEPEQNIYAGAKYLVKMHNLIKEEVEEPDRTWMALASYNIGRGHFHDAQILARKLGKNPHRWREMKEVLPLLQEKKYYKDLRYGYARGNEPVRYVARIRHYRDILEKLGKSENISGLTWQSREEASFGLKFGDRLTLAKGNAAFGQIVGSHFNRHSIAR